MGILSNLEPKRVFEIFEEMCAIPHGSTNTKAISDWCVAFGEKLGLELSGRGQQRDPDRPGHAGL